MKKIKKSMKKKNGTGISIPWNATVEFALQSLHDERQSHAAGGLAGRGGR